LLKYNGQLFAELKKNVTSLQQDLIECEAANKEL
jgi:hypothetical protein